jgi:hypothetical protein
LGTVVRSIRDSRSSNLASLASTPLSSGSFAWVMMQKWTKSCDVSILALGLGKLAQNNRAIE